MSEGSKEDRDKGIEWKIEGGLKEVEKEGLRED